MCIFAAAPVAGAMAAGTAATGTAASTAATIAAYAGLAASLAGTGMGFYGGLQQGKAASAAASYNALLAQREASILEMQAKDAEKRGQVEEDRFRQQMTAFQGEQISSLAASGVQVDSGSPLQILADTAEEIELDARTIRHNASMEAWNFKNQSYNALAQANLSKWEGKQARTNSYISAGTSLLSGLGSAFSTANKK